MLPVPCHIKSATLIVHQRASSLWTISRVMVNTSDEVPHATLYEAPERFPLSLVQQDPAVQSEAGRATAMPMEIKWRASKL